MYYSFPQEVCVCLHTTARASTHTHTFTNSLLATTDFKRTYKSFGMGVISKLLTVKCYVTGAVEIISVVYTHKKTQKFKLCHSRQTYPLWGAQWSRNHVTLPVSYPFRLTHTHTQRRLLR